jgi:hypothetical protein
VNKKGATNMVKTDDGVEIDVGDWIVVGEGVDRDFGRVSAIVGDHIRVYWDSVVETPCDVESIVGVYTRRPTEGEVAS